MAILTLAVSLGAQPAYAPPAGVRPPIRRGGASVLPGGRVIAPLGDEYVTGPGAFGLALSPSGRELVTANLGPFRASLTIMERTRDRWEVRQVAVPAGPDPFDPGRQPGPADWHGVSTGLAFSGDHNVYVSEGNTGRIVMFDSHEEIRRVIDLNQGGFHDSFTGELAFDYQHNILYAVDQANQRVAVIDARTRQVLASVPAGRLPFALALSPDRRTLYVTNAGMFAYQLLPGADPGQTRTTGLPFPAFGFPSPEASRGVERTRGAGLVMVPGLGDPNARESNSVAVLDVSQPAAARVVAWVRTGLPVGASDDGRTIAGGSSPSGVCATAEQVFVSNASQDSVSVLNARTNQLEAEIPIRIPGLEFLRGVLPIGVAYHQRSGWLLVAEAGIDAIGVIDVGRRRVLGHLPVAWFPTRVAVDEDTVFVANARGHGTGANAATGETLLDQFRFTQLYQGTLSAFHIPDARELPAHTAFVLEANGFTPHPPNPAARDLPGAIRHVVLIVKESRSYDEILGDAPSAANGPAMGAPALARFGANGYVDGHRRRISLRGVDVAPNHHAIARQWSFSDNFYSEADDSAGGHHWLTGAYPNAWAETGFLAVSADGKDFRPSATAPGRLAFAGLAASVAPEDVPEAGGIWDHLERHQVSFLNFGEGFELAGVAEGAGLEPTGARFLTNTPMPAPLYRNTSRVYPGFNIHISDQYRASAFIREIEQRYVRTGAALPRFLYLCLPGDYLAPARPEDGYPYEVSFLADNDYALGRVLEYLSGTKWWNQMAVFVTESGAAGGYDHIDARRTLLLCAGPWAKRNYVSHTNTGIPGLLKTIFRLLGLPPLNLFDAAAADLSDCFAASPDPAGYRVLAVDKRLFDPAGKR
ncbi:MAG TPA: bifunctional YncE family protein/alkaline phosphatase family protein [Bryobacteraceae bacterium]|nr:bifunctional YncE family protein/alkaline phosphatase family protein [Bryobacteraceae bacterium]